MPLYGYTRMFERMLRITRTSRSCSTPTTARSTDVIPYREHDLHRAGGRVLRLLLRQAAVPLAGVPARDAATASSTSRWRSVNYPNEHAYTRVTEFKHLTGQQHPRTSLVYEFPQARATRTTRCRKPESTALYSVQGAGGRRRRRALRRPSGDVQVLQHGPGRRAGADDVRQAGGTERGAGAAGAAHEPHGEAAGDGGGGGSGAGVPSAGGAERALQRCWRSGRAQRRRDERGPARNLCCPTWWMMMRTRAPRVLDKPRRETKRRRQLEGKDLDGARAPYRGPVVRRGAVLLQSGSSGGAAAAAPQHAVDRAGAPQPARSFQAGETAGNEDGDACPPTTSSHSRGQP